MRRKAPTFMSRNTERSPAARERRERKFREKRGIPLNANRPDPKRQARHGRVEPVEYDGLAWLKKQARAAVTTCSTNSLASLSQNASK